MPEQSARMLEQNKNCDKEIQNSFEVLNVWSLGKNVCSQKRASKSDKKFKIILKDVL